MHNPPGGLHCPVTMMSGGSLSRRLVAWVLVGAAFCAGSCSPSKDPAEARAPEAEPPAIALAPPPAQPEPEMGTPKTFPRPAPGGGGEAAGMEDSGRIYSEVPVYFATDRKRTDALEPDGRFGPERNLEGEHLSYGRAMITIPKTHRMGTVERPVWWRFEFREDVGKHVTLMEPEVMSGEAFYGAMRAAAAVAPGKELLLFVHGFNVGYADAMRRTGQLSYDLGFGGITFCYSWPSQGEVAKYLVDKENSEWTAPHLAKVLGDLQRETRFEKVHVIAHSMGARVLSLALSEAREAGFSLDLHNVILAAPDMDADIFREQILPKIKGSARRLTMYASSGDQALNLSTKFNGSRRLGLSGDGLVVVPELMDTVDASGVDTSLLGHSYYGSQGPVAEDLFKLVIKGLLPPERDLVLGRLGEWDLPGLKPQ
ncbi:MAG: alpha/beta fold hydrolase [Verrucomicrobia bacterium]|nr:alpha/beta fold hydrolase [Verrucomicrobiota bacterium]